MKTLISLLCAALFAGACTKPLDPQVTLQLDAEASSLSAVAMKNESVPVTLKFKGLSGWALASGQAELSIPLEKLETGDIARDGNIKALFFEIAKKLEFSTATFKLDSVEQGLLGLGNGQVLATRGEGVLTLHGAKLGMGGPLNFKRKGDSVSVDLGEDGWTILIDRTSLVPALKVLNKNCPQPHRVGNAVVVKGTLVFKR